MDGMSTYTKIVNAPSNLLIVGSTGSGRSNFLDLYIISLTKKYTPHELEVVLVDPKKVQLSQYKKLPHAISVVHDLNQLKETFAWATKESERRKAKKERMPQVVIVIEEAADFLVADKEQFEEAVKRITQDSINTGVYVVLSTVRGDILGQDLIDCFNARVVFRIKNEVSRPLLGSQNTEELSQSGSCYVRDVLVGSCERVQMPFVSDEEISGFLGSVEVKGS